MSVWLAGHSKAWPRGIALSFLFSESSFLPPCLDTFSPFKIFMMELPLPFYFPLLIGASRNLELGYFIPFSQSIFITDAYFFLIFLLLFSPFLSQFFISQLLSLWPFLSLTFFFCAFWLFLYHWLSFHLHNLICCTGSRTTNNFLKKNYNDNCGQKSCSNKILFIIRIKKTND